MLPEKSCSTLRGLKDGMGLKRITVLAKLDFFWTYKLQKKHKEALADMYNLAGDHESAIVNFKNAYPNSFNISTRTRKTLYEYDAQPMGCRLIHFILSLS